MVYPQWNEEGGSFFFDIPSAGTVKSVILGRVLKRRAFKPMLAVGLTDRNNREMYEQDIVRRWSGDKELPVAVVTHTPQFWWENQDTTQYEVIGNTFENPGLAPTDLREALPMPPPPNPFPSKPEPAGEPLKQSMREQKRPRSEPPS